MADLSYLDAVILGVVEGLTEYLPVSSTGHLTITEKLLGLEVNDPAVTAYTAVIQLGAIAATLLYFFRDIVRFAVAWFRGLGSAAARKDPDYGLAWAVVIGSIPVGIVGFLARDLISGAAAQPLGRGRRAAPLERRHGGGGAHLRALRGPRDRAW